VAAAVKAMVDSPEHAVIETLVIRPAG